MSKSKLRLGWLSYWGFGRGLAYMTRCFAQMVQDDYDVFILKQGDNEIADDFKHVKATITEYPGYLVPKEFFINWVKRNKLDAVLFSEYDQWGKDPNDLIKTTKELGIKAYASYLTLEKFKPEQCKYYDRIFCPTVTGERFLRKNKIRNFTYLPYSIDLNEFPKKEKVLNEKFTFFHPGGWGGIHNRKNTDVVIKAFQLLREEYDNIKLIITSQKPLDKDKELLKQFDIEIIDKNLTRQELIDLYYKADISVLPSKWESIGLPILESMAAGVPVITSKVPPMCEFVIDCVNGYTCNPDMTRYADISIGVAEIDHKELKKRMEISMNKDIYPLLSKNARNVIERLYDLEKNKKYFLEFLEKDLK